MQQPAHDPRLLTQLPDGTVTLGDLWPGPGDAELWACIVGGKTSPGAIANGHYYHGPIGRRQLGRLIDAGLFQPVPGEEFQDLQAVTQGIGFVNLSQVPRSEDDPETVALMREGSVRVERERASRDVGLVISMWRHGTRELLGHEGRPGFQPTDTAWGAEVFRMPSPYARAIEAVAVMGELADWLSEHKPR
jgi:TDG/mug DNA glycosylase family protein